MTMRKKAQKEPEQELAELCRTEQELAELCRLTDLASSLDWNGYCSISNDEREAWESRESGSRERFDVLLGSLIDLIAKQDPDSTHIDKLLAELDQIESEWGISEAHCVGKIIRRWRLRVQTS